MLPIQVPIESWRFPTDNLLEFNSPYFDNEGIIWGPPFGGFLPPAHQTSLDTYNEWCYHAYDWVAICEHLEEIDFQQAAIWGFDYRGSAELLLESEISANVNSSEIEDSELESDSIVSFLQTRLEFEEDAISEFSDRSPAPPE
jgi:hypothetical protein